MTGFSSSSFQLDPLPKQSTCHVPRDISHQHSPHRCWQGFVPAAWQSRAGVAIRRLRSREIAVDKIDLAAFPPFVEISIFVCFSIWHVAKVPAMVSGDQWCSNVD